MCTTQLDNYKWRAWIQKVVSEVSILYLYLCATSDRLSVRLLEIVSKVVVDKQKFRIVWIIIEARWLVFSTGYCEFFTLKEVLVFDALL